PIVKIPNYAYKHKGNLNFEDVGQSWGLSQASFSNGAVILDLDLDGDLDYVVNNINDPAFVFENTLNQQEKKPNYLRIKLQGPKNNADGLGAKVWVKFGKGQLGYQEMQVVRGYMSSTEPVLHFGLDSAAVVDEVLVKWADGKVSSQNQIPANQVLKIAYAQASPGTAAVALANLGDRNQLFSEVSDSLGISYVHQEVDKIDYNIQRTIPHKLSQYGPTLAVGDLNGDGREDLVVGSSSGFAPVWYSQNGNGSFTQKNLLPAGESISQEVTGVLLVDLDNDADLDMYLLSGSAEFVPGSPEYRDRVYFNDGKGNFKLDPSSSIAVGNGSVVRGADFDGDGFLDVFVGGRAPIGQYPIPEKSFLLKNEKGKLTDVTKFWIPELENLGMLTDALWSDVNRDGKVDLVVVGELMPITLFLNTGKRFELAKATGLEDFSGWWNSIISADIDQDGDSDWVVGNLGGNNPFHASAVRPYKVYAKDFDANGSVDPVSFAFYKSKIGGDYQAYPTHFWDDLMGQSPLFRRKFDRYKYFALSTEQTFFTEEERKDARVLTGNYDRSAWVENLGNGKFILHELPWQAQLAPINGMLAEDVNQDGFLDLVQVGNDYGNEVFIGRLDASVGWVFLGDGRGGFTSIPARESGFVVPGDAKALVKLTGGGGEALYIASQNRSKLLSFSAKQQGATVLQVPADAMAVELVLANGKKQRIDSSYGAGFGSQSSRAIHLPQGVKSASKLNYKGEASALPFPK
ncbi:MAG: FG-GAP-like repeat-containing protein, partial [Algoriphagus sp.]|nr:FG-GAP-like repeat-containing protein [Algoriphagus sp.]